jgi:nucleoside-diphosphate-sugar epimerase
MMKILVAGASGAIGRRLIPMLVSRGHTVTAMTRSPEKVHQLQALGASPIVADALDRSRVIEVGAQVRPDVVIHQLTALARARSMKKFDEDFAMTNRLRTEATDNLLAAARAAGTQRLIAQSYGSWNYERTGTALKTEEDGFDPTPPAHQAKTLAAIRYLETAVLGAEGIQGVVLRYANLYGPGTGFAVDGDLVSLVRKRMLPIVGGGQGVWSFIHIDDAAAATTAAVDAGEPGIYNIVDDEPASVSVWLPELARALGARPPLRVPLWLGRLAVGEVGVSMMTRIRGASNAKAKAEFGWEPGYSSWRQGFWSGLTPQAAPDGARLAALRR